VADYPVVFSGAGVEVVRLSLTAGPEETHQLAASLASGERERAERYRFERDRHRFVVGRGRLRNLVASHLGLVASEVRFRYGEHGKPFVEGGGSFRFNVSHAGDVMVVATSSTQEVGVDVEQIRHLADLDGVPRYVCCPSELARLALIPPAERQTSFLRLWTCKEAWLKARGKGLSDVLDSPALELPCDASPGVPLGGAPGAPGWVCELVPAPGYVGAVAGV
jgi:4'-phosphopantetheinyl transferase